MFLENKVLSPGKKIKAIRKILKINQEELTKGVYNRSLISYIENDKIKLSKKVAEILANNINQIAKQKNIPLEITPDYLLEEEIVQVNKIIRNSLNILNNINTIDNHIFHNEVNRIENLFKTYDVKELKLKAYKKIANLYYKNKNYNNSYIYYLKALKVCMQTTNSSCFPELLLELGKCSIKMLNYNVATLINEYALSILKSNSTTNIDLLKKAYFNLSLSYKKLGNYDSCLSTLENMELNNLQLDTCEILDILLLKGNCYLRKKQFKSAKDTYFEALNISESNNILNKSAMIYINIANIYNNLGKTHKAIEFANKSFNIRKNKKDINLANTLIFLGELYLKINEIEKAHKNIVDAIEILKYKGYEKINIDSFIQSYKLLINIYIIKDKETLIEKIAYDIEKLFQYNISKIQKQELKELLVKIGYYYMERDFYKSKEFISKSLNL
ncbi:helix-turn-helix transcriptional regulator [Caloranaerobacter azorensis]|nr:helix-turn-helix transcriptional regulator [Caloranaerobacter azorensis]